MRGFLHNHSLTIIASLVLTAWVLLYVVSNPNTHLGNFFGNAIADWTGVVTMVVASKYMYEKGSSESRLPPPDEPGRWLRDFFRDHSLTVFLALTLLIWILIFRDSGVNTKWGQVAGNITSEWVQSIGMVLLTKRFIERHSKESGGEA